MGTSSAYLVSLGMPFPTLCRKSGSSLIGKDGLSTTMCRSLMIAAISAGRCGTSKIFSLSSRSSGISFTPQNWERMSLAAFLEISYC